MNKVMSEIAVIASGIIGVAIVAVLVSRNAQTSSVIESAGKAFSGAIGAATAPVSGGFGGFGQFSSF